MNPQSLRDPHAEKAPTKPDGPTGPDDPFPAWLAEWEAACVAFEETTKTMDDDQAAEFHKQRIFPTQDKIKNTSARTITGVFAKLRMISYFHNELGSVPPDNLIATALAGAECVMRGQGAVEESKDAGGADPLVALWSEWRDNRRPARPAGTDEEEWEEAINQAGDRMNEIEPQIFAAPATTLAGAFAQLSVLIWQLDDEGLSDIRDGIEATLASVAAAQGATS